LIGRMEIKPFGNETYRGIPARILGMYIWFMKYYLNLWLPLRNKMSMLWYMRNIQLVAVLKLYFGSSMCLHTLVLQFTYLYITV
jgi:hypothetical protein